MRRKHVFIAVGAVIALVAIIAVILLTHGSNQGSGTSATSPQLTVPSTSTLALPSYPAPDTAKYAQILNGSNKAAQAELLLPEFRTANWSADEVVPAGSTFVIDQNSFWSSGIIGQVTGRFETAGGLVVRNCVIWLQYQDAHWLIWTFEEV